MIFNKIFFYLKNKIIRTVGNPEERFSEDALRMLRAVRFATTLNFIIEENTAQAIKKNSLCHFCFGNNF